MTIENAFLCSGRNIISSFSKNWTCLWNTSVTSFTYSVPWLFLIAPTPLTSAPWNSWSFIIQYHVSFWRTYFCSLQGFHIPHKIMDLKWCFSSHIDQCHCNPSVFLLCTRTNRSATSVMKLEFLFHKDTLSCWTIIGASAVLLWERSPWHITSLGPLLALTDGYHNRFLCFFVAFNFYLLTGSMRSNTPPHIAQR